MYPSIPTTNPDAGIEVEKVFLYPKENAKNHHTEKYELVTDQNIPVLRRATTFRLAIKTKLRGIDLEEKDVVNLVFEFGRIYQLFNNNTIEDNLSLIYFHTYAYYKIQFRYKR